MERGSVFSTLPHKSVFLRVFICCCCFLFFGVKTSTAPLVCSMALHKLEGIFEFPLQRSSFLKKMLN